MKIISVDTTSKDSAIALVSFGKCVAYQIHSSGNFDDLLFSLSKLFSKTGFCYSDVDAYAVTTGPGSFTGIRAGIATVLGINLVNKKQVLGVTNFEAYSFYASLNNKNNLPISVILQAYRNQLCGQIFDHALNSICEPILCNYDNINKFIPKNSLICGDFKDLLFDFSILYLDKPLAVFTGMMAYHKIKFGKSTELKPLYFMKLNNFSEE